MHRSVPEDPLGQDREREGRAGQERAFGAERPWRLFSLTAGPVFVLYLLTLAPSVTGGDAGELITAARTFGSPHPPGYPLFAILGWLPGVVPVGPLALRFNLLSAAVGAAAAGVLAVAAARWAATPWAGIAAAGLFAFSPLVWEYSTGAEVFALNHLLVASLLLCAVSHGRTGEVRWVVAGAFAFGLGMANHHTILFLGVPLAGALVLLDSERWGSLPALARPAAAFAAGLLPYLYLPLAAWRPAEVTWGDQRTPSGLLTHVLRREYGTLRLGGEGYLRDVSLLDQLALYSGFQLREVLFVGGVLAAVGVWRGGRLPAGRLVAAGTAAGLLLYVVVFHHLANLPVGEPLFLQVQRRFWQMPHLVVCLWAGVGLAAVAGQGAWRGGQDRNSLRRSAATPPGQVAPPARAHALRHAPPASRPSAPHRAPPAPRASALRCALPALFPAAALLLAVLPAVLHFAERRDSGSLEFLEYAEALLAPLPEDALLLARGDLIVNTVQYAQVAEGVRPDVRLLDLERLTYPWMRRVVERHLPDVRVPGDRLVSGDRLAPGDDGFTLGELLEANAGRRVFLAGDLRPEEVGVAQRYGLWPLGLARELVPLEEAPEPEWWRRTSEAALPQLPPPDRAPPEGSWTEVVRLDLVEAHHRHAVKLLEIGIARDDPAWLAAAAAALTSLVERDPGVHPLVYRNLGLAHARLVPFDASHAAAMREAWEHYLQVADPADPARPAIREALAR